MKSLIISGFICLCISYVITQTSAVTGVNLFLITGNDISNRINVSWTDVKHSFNNSYDSAKKSVIFAFGWSDTLNSTSVSAFITAYKTRNEHNVFILDWSKYSTLRYLQAVWNIDAVGNYVATNLNNVMYLGYDLDSFHFVGFSLGAHLCGYIGRYLKSLANFTLPRITGLDPAGPLFYPEILFFKMKPLNAEDAKFVDVIHTNSRKAGAPGSIGHVDFFPNGGKSQPGCPYFSANNCSHHRSWQYYVESVTYQQSEKKFQAIKCSTFVNFNQISCSGAPMYNYMGYYADPGAAGIFFLNTSSKAPYSL